MNAVGHATWRGTWKEGSGALSTTSATLAPTPYDYGSRFDGTSGASPEELLAVAQAGCFNQALANNLGMIGFQAEQIETSVDVTLGFDEQGHPKIEGMHVTTTATVPRLTNEQFAECANRARTNCTIAKLFKRELTMTASLR